MVEYLPEGFPERLFRPDASITSWRRLFDHIRGEEPAPAPELAAATDLTAATPAARA